MVFYSIGLHFIWYTLYLRILAFLGFIHHLLLISEHSIL